MKERSVAASLRWPFDRMSAKGTLSWTIETEGGDMGMAACAWVDSGIEAKASLISGGKRTEVALRWGAGPAGDAIAESFSVDGAKVSEEQAMEAFQSILARTSADPIFRPFRGEEPGKRGPRGEI